MGLGNLAAATLAMAALGQAPQAEPAQPDWELKGVRLGASVAQVQGAAPGLKCETEAHDPGLVYCIDRQSSLGGQPAFLVVKLLEGQAVYIGLENLTYAQVVSAGPTLLEKFGTPAFSESVVGDAHDNRSVRTVRRVRHVWRRPDGVVAMTSPFDWTNERRGITYSSISLMLEEKQKQWGTRFNVRDRATDL